MALPGVEAIERSGLRAWPGIEVEWDGGWVRRAAGGYTKRANSLQCFDPGDDAEAEARLAAAIAWFWARNLPPVVRTTPLESPGLAAELDRQGWAVIDHSHLYAMPLPQVEADERGRVLPVLDTEFLGAQGQLRSYNQEQLGRLQALLAAMEVPAAGVVVYAGGEAVATGLMAIADGIVVTGNVVTSPAHRRQGLAAAMMRTGLAWAASNGARVAALNVQADNVAAKTLYEGLGYRRHYDYAYRVPGNLP